MNLGHLGTRDTWIFEPCVGTTRISKRGESRRTRGAAGFLSKGCLGQRGLLRAVKIKPKDMVPLLDCHDFRQFRSNRNGSLADRLVYVILWLQVARRPFQPFSYSTWVWVNIKPPEDRRFWSMYLFTRVPFWVPIFDPQPFGFLVSLPGSQGPKGNWCLGFPCSKPMS